MSVHSRSEVSWNFSQLVSRGTTGMLTVKGTIVREKYTFYSINVVHLQWDVNGDDEGKCPYLYLLKVNRNSWLKFAPEVCLLLQNNRERWRREADRKPLPSFSREEASAFLCAVISSDESPEPHWIHQHSIENSKQADSFRRPHFMLAEPLKTTRRLVTHRLITTFFFFFFCRLLAHSRHPSGPSQRRGALMAPWHSQSRPRWCVCRSVLNHTFVCLGFFFLSRARRPYQLTEARLFMYF